MDRVKGWSAALIALFDARNERLADMCTTREFGLRYSQLGAKIDDEMGHLQVETTFGIQQPCLFRFD